MSRHTRRLVTATIGAAALASVLAAAPAQASTDDVFGTAASAPAGTAAIGLFQGKPTGISLFTNDGSNIDLRGVQSNLNNRRSYFSVIYGNGNCDPAQAFPVAIGSPNRQGVVRFSTSAPNPNGIMVGGTGSVSVRIADTDANGNPTDQDGDGIKGAGDVVAVPGNPSVGLVQCDQSPFTN